MKILFLIPPPLDQSLPAERIFGCNYGIYPQPNIFVLYPATILKNAGNKVEILDFPAMGKSKREFEAFCKIQDFDIIFFYTVFLSKRTDLAARDLLHKNNPHTLYIFLSTEPSANPNDFIDKSSIVIRGEPDSQVLSVVKALETSVTLSGISGISYTQNGLNIHEGGSCVIKDLDSLPFPDRSLLQYSNYYNPKLSRLPFTTMIASRGCSFGCYYCVPNSLDFAREIEFKRETGMSGKPPVRLRSAENVIHEFAWLAKLGFKSISFIDNQFVWGVDRTIKICDGIAAFDVEWSCLARADMLLDKSMIMAMGRAGCKYIDIGIESFDQRILDYIGKGCKVDAVYAAVDNLRSAGIEIEFNILLASCPLETEETIERTFREALNLDPDYILFSICTPFPYTRFNQLAKSEGWMIKPEYEAIDPMKESFISYPHLPKNRLDRIIRQLYVRYYFRPSYIWNRFKKVNNYRELLHKAKAALSILR